MPAEIQVNIRLDKSDTEQNEQKAKEEEEASYRIGREAQIRQILTNEMFLWYLLDQNVK
jgi:hypothetical protein